MRDVRVACVLLGESVEVGSDVERGEPGERDQAITERDETRERSRDTGQQEALEDSEKGMNTHVSSKYPRSCPSAYCNEGEAAVRLAAIPTSAGEARGQEQGEKRSRVFE